ncbi:MFS transporter [Flaviflexus huanghaiensis]|uniref:MFS transporter n=1 Tax=Flaviflexus huanghaiensis TaxID=1111473 RepID=UPI0015FB8C29|nr:MFS transporter [Flaviflexus huanghaiensis]
MSTTSGRTMRGRVTAWALWDWASAAFNAVVTTFVFSVYIANADLFGDNANASLGWTMTAAGIFVAIIAPVVGQWTDRSGKKRGLIASTTAITIAATAALAFVRPDESYLWLGLLLLAVGNVAFDTGSVVYNAMLSDISTPKTIGRISGLGWGLGYVGGIVLMLILYVGIIGPEIGWFGVTSEEGMNIRVAMVLCAVWTLVFSLPLMLTATNSEPKTTKRIGVMGSYRQLFTSIAGLWRRDRSIVWFLVASAIYRDGLAGVFAFGGVLAGEAFGFSSGEVLIFGIIANLVAGIATITFGYLDDRIGARPVILFSLGSMVALGLLIFILHDQGPLVFWIAGLLLCIFVGPAQSSSRTYLARIIPAGEEGEIFGLYATTGRAVSFLSPFMYSTVIILGALLLDSSKREAAYFGILGIVLVLLVGFVAFLLVRPSNERVLDNVVP